MFKLKVYVSLCFLFTVFLVIGQDFESFTTLRSGGELPKDFTGLSTDKYDKDVSRNTNEDLDDTFFLESRFMIDKLLLGGRVLFNEPCSDYVNSVADYLLIPEPGLRNTLRFYVLKSNVPNAFSTDQGIIFITTAMIASIENEAQLAFILAHEISHFTEKHVRNSYVDNEEIKKGTGEHERSSYETRIEKLSQYSKNHEFEADELGIELYLKTEYDIEEIFEGFGALLYSYLPYEDRSVDSTFLNTEFMTIPGEFFRAKVQEISKTGRENDDKSTHPNIEKRMDAAISVLGDRQSKGRLHYKVSEDEFGRVRSLVRLEQINLLLSKRSYGRALYCVYIMEKEIGQNRFLTLSKVKALYGLVKYKNYNRFSEVTTEYAKSEGESSVLNYFLGELNKKQLNVVAYRHAYDALQKYPEPVFEAYEKDLFKELALNSGVKPKDFKEYTYDGYTDQIKSIDFDIQDSLRKVDNDESLSKYEKIKLKKNLNNLEDPEYSEYDPVDDFHLFVLSDLIKNENLAEEIIAMRAADDKNDARVKYFVTKENLNHGYYLALEKVVIVDPSFEKYGINNERLHVDSEKSKVDLANVYVKEYPRLNLERSILDSKLLVSSDAQKYNNIGVLYQWVMEVLEHEGIEMISSTHESMQQLTKNYDCQHFVFTGIYAFEKKSRFFKSNRTELTAFAVNAETDQLEFVQYNHARMKPEGRRLDALIFNILYQLDREPEPELEPEWDE